MTNDSKPTSSEYESEEEYQEEEALPSLPVSSPPSIPSSSVAARPKLAPKRYPRPPASYFLLAAVLGMILLAYSVFTKAAIEMYFRPLSVLGIAIVVWAFVGIGSLNEAKPSP